MEAPDSLPRLVALSGEGSERTRKANVTFELKGKWPKKGNAISGYFYGDAIYENSKREIIAVRNLYEGERIYKSMISISDDDLARPLEKAYCERSGKYYLIYPEFYMTLAMYIKDEDVLVKDNQSFTTEFRGFLFDIIKGTKGLRACSTRMACVDMPLVNIQIIECPGVATRKYRAKIANFKVIAGKKYDHWGDIASLIEDILRDERYQSTDAKPPTENEITAFIKELRQASDKGDGRLLRCPAMWTDETRIDYIYKMNNHAMEFGLTWDDIGYTRELWWRYQLDQKFMLEANRQRRIKSGTDYDRRFIEFACLYRNFLEHLKDFKAFLKNPEDDVNVQEFYIRKSFPLIFVKVNDFAPLLLDRCKPYSM